MNSSMQLGITLTADGRDAEANINKFVKNIEKVGDSSKKASQSLGGIEKSARNLSSAASVAGQAMAALGVAVSVKELYRTVATFEKLNASLKTITGSAASAASAMSMIKNFAQETPYDVQQVTEAFIRLQSLGLDATSASLRSFGNTASAMGKPLMQFIEAVADATTNEFERLKEFGIKARQEGDKVTFTFQGQSTTIQKNAKDIQDYLLKIGNTKFAGGMAEQMNTMEGAMSNLKDAFSNLVDFLGQGTIGRLIKQDFQVAAEIINDFTKALNATFGTGIQSQIDAMTISIKDLKEEISDMEKSKGTIWDQIFGTSDDIERRKADLEDMKKRLAELQGMQAQSVGNVGQAPAMSASAAKNIGGVIQQKIIAAAQQAGIDPALALAIAQAESSFNPRATSPRTKYGYSRGLFQILDSTAQGMGVRNPSVQSYDVDTNIGMGMKYIAKSIAQFGNDVRLVAAAHNAGPGAVVKYGGVPPYKETMGYANNVAKYYQQYKEKLGSGSMVFDEKAAEKDRDKYLSIVSNAIDERNRLEAEKRKQREQANELEVKKIENQIKELNDKASIDIKTAISQKPVEEQMKLIDEMQAKEDGLIKKKFEQANKVNPAVESARSEVKAIDQKINLLNKEKGKQQEIDELRLKRKTAMEGVRTAEQAGAKGNLDMQEQLAESARKYDALRQDARTNEIEYQKALGEFNQNNYRTSVETAKAIIDLEQKKLTASMAGREAARQAAMEGKTGVELGIQLLDNQNQRTQDRIALINAERDASVRKLELDRQVLVAQEETLRQQIASTADRKDQLALTQQLLDVQQQIAQNSAAQQAVGTSTSQSVADIYNEQATQAAQAGIQKVAEEQLRLNAAFENGVQQAQLFATSASQAFGQFGASIGKVVTSFAQYQQQIYQVTRDLENAKKKISEEVAAKVITPEEGWKRQYEEQQKAAEKSAQYQIAAYGNISEAAQGFFKQGTKGYAALQNATKVFRMFEMAMAIKSMVTQVMGNTTIAASDAARTGTEVTNSAVRGQAKAAEAAANQASGGDPYSAFARTAAMIALMAAIGFAVAGATSGGSTTSRREERQKMQGTGTVLGDSEAQSMSIANSLETIRDNTSNDLNYSAAMLRALEDLSLNILALANQVTMTVMPSIDAAIKASGMKFGKTNISLFSGFNKQLTDAGIGWFETSLEQIFQGGFSAKMYADVTKSFEVMQSALSSETTTYVRNASKDVTNQIAQIFRDMVKALQEGGKAFGLSGQDVLDSLKGFKIGMEQISLKDMSMEEQTAALNAVFSKITDKMAQRLNNQRDLQLDPFRKAGEGMAETFFRVAEGINRAKGELEKLGMTAVDYKTLSAAQKQGDVAAEIFRNSIQAQAQLSQSVRDYVGVLKGSAEDIRDAYQQIISASNLLKTAGIGDTNLSQTMTNAAGGLDAFVAAMESFNENFLSEADRYAGDVRVLSEQFGALGYALPDSKDAFVALIRSIDTTDDAGKKLFGQMIALSESFAKVANEAQAIRDKYASILDPFKAISDRIKEVGTDFGKLLAGVTGESQGRINAIGNAAAAARNPLLGARGGLQAELDGQSQTIIDNRNRIDAWQKQLDAELAKKPKNQNKKLIRRLQDYIRQSNDSIMGLTAMNDAIRQQIDDINRQIAEIDSQEGIDKGTEAGRLAAEKIGIIDEARLAMGATLEQIFADIAQTIQQAQQRLQSVVNLQKDIETQLAQLQGPQAILALSNSRYGDSMKAVDSYFGDYKNIKVGNQPGSSSIRGLNSSSVMPIGTGSAKRDVEEEMRLIQDAKQAVMDKYNAEIAAIQEGVQAQADALNASLQLQIDAINAATEAQIKAQSKLDAAAQKAMQKQFDAEQKAMQKAHDAQLKALGDELDAANKLRDAVKGIQDYVRGMALGGNSPLSPEQRLAEAQRQYQELLARAQGGDADAMQKLSGASDAYLEASKQYYGSGTQYANTFDAVKNAMSAIGGMSAPDPDSIQSRIDALREAQADEMDRLRELQAEKLDALREKQQEAIEAMRQSAQKQIEAAQKATQQAIADLSDPNKNAAMRAAREAAERDLAKLAKLAELTRIEAAKQAEEAKQKAQEQAEAALKMAQDQLDALQAGTRLSAQQLGVLSGILQGMGLQPIPIEGYAKGGYAKAGLALVGEQGPEIVRFERPAQVMTADETRDALRGGNNEAIVQAIAELKAEMRAVVVTQSNANPQIIAELSEMKNRLAKMERTQRFTVGS